MLICVDFEHAFNQSQPMNDEMEVTPEQLLAGVPSPRIPISLKELVEDLLNVTPSGTPDYDGDMLFDFMEQDIGSNPLHGDSDTDGLRDGIETFLKTNPTSNDTDGDKVPDGLEVALWLDPTSNDTDADGVIDSDELEWGTNPFSNDTDHDGIPDNLDADTTYTEIIEVILVLESELDEDAIGFKEELEDRTDLTLVSYEDFLTDYTQESYIVLVGRPNSTSDTIGGLIYDLLEGTGTALEDMIATDSHEMAVRHGVWTPNQTVVLLSSTRPTDIYTVLSVLRSRGISILPNSAIVDYNIAPAEFIIYEIDTVKQTDSVVRIALSSPVIPTIQIRKYNESTIQYSLTHSNGLSSDEVSMGRYLDVSITSVGTSTDFIEHAFIKIYYRESDLDRNGNGTMNDTEDLNESTLVLYCYDDSSSTWIKLSDELDWVLEVGVNTTDFEIFGESYVGFVWARVTHLSLFAIGGVLNGYMAQDNTLLLLGLGGAGVAVIGAGLLWRRRGKKPKSQSKQKQVKKSAKKSTKKKGKK
jgi:hypothetical protein